MKITHAVLVAITLSAAWCVGLVLASLWLGIGMGPPLLVALSGPAAAVGVFIIAIGTLANDSE